MTVQMNLIAAANTMSGRVKGENLNFLGVSTDSRSVAQSDEMAFSVP